MRWHFHLTPPADGAINMALDEALMHRAAVSGRAVFRIYGWSTPTLSLGRNQRARGLYDGDVARDLGIAFVRRPTGGRALLHHREVTYSVTLPARDAHEANAAYEFINDVLLDGLARLGVRAERAANAKSMPPGPRPCFDAPSAHEIAVNDRKLVGSAQWRRGGALLQHGSILVHDDQTLIARLMKADGAFIDPPRAATLAAALGRSPAVAEIADHFLEALERRTARQLEPLVVDNALTEDCGRLRRVYLDDAWTWRR
jgi:lipoate-protein ligase A